MDERWESLDYLGLANYEVSTFGRVFNIKTNEELKGSIYRAGYRVIGFRDANKKRFNHFVHRLVAHSFIPYNGIYKPTFEYMKEQKITVDHIDRNRSHDNILNLRWANGKEQISNQTSERKPLKSKSVYQYNLDGSLKKIWNSAMEASKFTGFDESSIRHCCRGDYLTSYNFMWKYEFDKDIDLYKSEIWRTIPTDKFGEIYASSFGRIKPLSGNPTYGHFSPDGYRVVEIKDFNGKKHTKRVHRLVVAAFDGNNDKSIVDIKHDTKDCKLVVNHKNGITDDNRPENLELIAQKENVDHAYATGLTDMSKQYVSVIRIHPITNQITEYYESIKEAVEANEAFSANISKACTGEREICAGYKWAYANDPDWQDKINQFKSSTEKQEFEAVEKKKRLRSVFRIDPETNTISGYYPSIKEAQSKNVKATNIGGVCRGVNTLTGGLKWCYADTPEIADLLKQYLTICPYTP